MTTRPSPTRAVKLWNLMGAALLVPSKTGVSFSNQVGGHACLQPSVEGILLPFNNDPPLDAPHLSTHRQLGELFRRNPRMTSDQADAVDQVLASDAATRCARVNRQMLSESNEAWVHVQITPDEMALFENFGEFKGILTWPNSD